MAEHLIREHIKRVKDNLFHARRHQDSALEHIYMESLRTLERLLRDYLYERSKLERPSVEESEDDC